MEKKEKMVWVAGMLLPESKVEGRLASLKATREEKKSIQEQEAARRAEETEELRAAGWSTADINSYFLTQKLNTMENMGLGISKRIIRVSPE